MKNITIRKFSDKNSIGAKMIYDITTIVLVPTISFSTEKEALYRYYAITFAFLPIRIGIAKRFKRNQKYYIMKAFKDE